MVYLFIHLWFLFICLFVLNIQIEKWQFQVFWWEEFQNTKFKHLKVFICEKQKLNLDQNFLLKITQKTLIWYFLNY